MSTPFEVLEKPSIPVTEPKSGKEHFEMLKVAGRVGGDTLGSLLCILTCHHGHWCLQSWWSWAML